MSAIPNLNRTRASHFQTNPPLASVLCELEAAQALPPVRRGLDNVQIASRMGCTPAAAANALFDARERERSVV
ncbi:hypothetical protein [Bosea sp. UC22_33]|uniref:hypothetical protein n=1 Tax=Bosea sp. UC22_33 TaxID=3350165 RepID=UPI00366F53B8